MIRARGEAEAAEMVGRVASGTPAFLELRRLEAVRDIAKSLASSSNKVMLSSESLMLDVLNSEHKRAETEK